MALDQQQELGRRLHQEQENYDLRAQLAEEKQAVATNEKEMIKEQSAKLNHFVSQLTAENEKLMADRDMIRKDSHRLQDEMALVKDQMHDLSRQKKAIEDRNNLNMQQLLESTNANNNADSDVSAENMQLRDANGRLKISYSKLKTDYTQIVDDLR